MSSWPCSSSRATKLSLGGESEAFALEPSMAETAPSITYPVTSVVSIRPPLDCRVHWTSEHVSKLVSCIIGKHNACFECHVSPSGVGVVTFESKMAALFLVKHFDSRAGTINFEPTMEPMATLDRGRVQVSTLTMDVIRTDQLKGVSLGHGDSVFHFPLAGSKPHLRLVLIKILEKLRDANNVNYLVMEKESHLRLFVRLVRRLELESHLVAAVSLIKLVPVDADPEVDCGERNVALHDNVVALTKAHNLSFEDVLYTHCLPDDRIVWAKQSRVYFVDVVIQTDNLVELAVVSFSSRDHLHLVLSKGEEERDLMKMLTFLQKRSDPKVAHLLFFPSIDIALPIMMAKMKELKLHNEFARSVQGFLDLRVTNINEVESKECKDALESALRLREIALKHRTAWSEPEKRALSIHCWHEQSQETRLRIRSSRPCKVNPGETVVFDELLATEEVDCTRRFIFVQMIEGAEVLRVQLTLKPWPCITMRIRNSTNGSVTLRPNSSLGVLVGVSEDTPIPGLLYLGQDGKSRTSLHLLQHLHEVAVAEDCHHSTAFNDSHRISKEKDENSGDRFVVIYIEPEKFLSKKVIKRVQVFFIPDEKSENDGTDSLFDSGYIVPSSVFKIDELCSKSRYKLDESNGYEQWFYTEKNITVEAKTDHVVWTEVCNLIEDQYSNGIKPKLIMLTPNHMAYLRDVLKGHGLWQDFMHNIHSWSDLSSMFTSLTTHSLGFIFKAYEDVPSHLDLLLSHACIGQQVDETRAELIGRLFISEVRNKIQVNTFPLELDIKGQYNCVMVKWQDSMTALDVLECSSNTSHFFKRDGVARLAQVISSSRRVLLILLNMQHFADIVVALGGTEEEQGLARSLLGVVDFETFLKAHKGLASIQEVLKAPKDLLLKSVWQKVNSHFSNANQTVKELAKWAHTLNSAMLNNVLYKSQNFSLRHGVCRVIAVQDVLVENSELALVKCKLDAGLLWGGRRAVPLHIVVEDQRSESPVLIKRGEIFELSLKVPVKRNQVVALAFDKYAFENFNACRRAEEEKNERKLIQNKMSKIETENAFKSCEDRDVQVVTQKSPEISKERQGMMWSRRSASPPMQYRTPLKDTHRMASDKTVSSSRSSATPSPSRQPPKREGKESESPRRRRGRARSRTRKGGPSFSSEQRSSSIDHKETQSKNAREDLTSTKRSPKDSSRTSRGPRKDSDERTSLNDEKRASKRTATGSSLCLSDRFSRARPSGQSSRDYHYESSESAMAGIVAKAPTLAKACSLGASDHWSLHLQLKRLKLPSQIYLTLKGDRRIRRDFKELAVDYAKLKVLWKESLASFVGETQQLLADVQQAFNVDNIEGVDEAIDNVLRDLNTSISFDNFEQMLKDNFAMLWNVRSRELIVLLLFHRYLEAVEGNEEGMSPLTSNDSDLLQLKDTHSNEASMTFQDLESPKTKFPKIASNHQSEREPRRTPLSKQGEHSVRSMSLERKTDSISGSYSSQHARFDYNKLMERNSKRMELCDDHYAPNKRCGFGHHNCTKVHLIPHSMYIPFCYDHIKGYCTKDVCGRPHMSFNRLKALFRAKVEETDCNEEEQGHQDYNSVQRHMLGGPFEVRSLQPLVLRGPGLQTVCARLCSSRLSLCGYRANFRGLSLNDTDGIVIYDSFNVSILHDNLVNVTVEITSNHVRLEQDAVLGYISDLRSQ